VYYKLDRNTAYTASENLIAADVKTLLKFIELNYPDWLVGTIVDLGTLFDIVDGTLVGSVPYNSEFKKHPKIVAE
jgi:hypothetical protein